MTVHELSAATRAVRAQLLDRLRPITLLDAIHHLTLLQIDPTAAIAPNAQLACRAG